MSPKNFTEVAPQGEIRRDSTSISSSPIVFEQNNKSMMPLTKNEQQWREKKEKPMATASSCDHAAVMEAITRGCERTMQLRAVLLPFPPVDPRSELAASLFDEALRSFSAGLSMLEPGCQSRASCSHLATVQASLPREGDRKSMNSDEKRETRKEGDKSIARKRRRVQHSWPIETSLPHYDGHRWRKYGQKEINGSKYPRSYYRCTYRDGQGCQATKTVQQKDDGDPPKFIVTYDKQHKCKSMEMYSPVIIDSTPKNATALHFEDKSFKSLQKQPGSPLTAEDENNDNIILLEFPDVVRKNSVVDTPEISEEICNIVSALSPDFDDLEWMNYLCSSY